MQIPKDESERVFCQEILAQKLLGTRFTFLFGAGISVGSGFPAGPSLKGYLAHCLRILLFPKKGHRPWNPREDPFPPPEEVLRNEFEELDETLPKIIGK